MFFYGSYQVNDAKSIELNTLETPTPLFVLTLTDKLKVNQKMKTTQTFFYVCLA